MLGFTVGNAPEAAVIASILAAFALATAAQPTLEDLAWMTGDRFDGGQASATEEVWIGSNGKVLLGMSLSQNERTGRVSWEHMRIERRSNGSLAFIALPSGQAETVFPLKSYEGRRAVFENLAHDFPQRVIYWDKGNGVVGARVEGLIGGQARSVEWTFAPKP